MAEKGDMSERKQSRELDSLRRDTAAVARLLRQARLDEIPSRPQTGQGKTRSR